MTKDNRALGKFRGTVRANVDPMLIGRILVEVPAVLGPGVSSWAMPCVPFAGINTGFLAVPPIQSGVWVEFEGGDPDYPIWVGGYWGTAAETPVLSKTALAPVPSVTVQTPLKNGMVISDGAGPMGVGGIFIQSATGASLAVNDTGIYLNNAKGAQISLVGPTVDVNLGALTVT